MTNVDTLMRKLIWLLVVLLIISHQDFWNWEDERLVLEFMPIGLFYHVCISIAAAVVWLLACTFAWPKGIDDFEDERTSNRGDA